MPKVRYFIPCVEQLDDRVLPSVTSMVAGLPTVQVGDLAPVSGPLVGQITGALIQNEFFTPEIWGAVLTGSGSLDSLGTFEVSGGVYTAMIDFYSDSGLLKFSNDQGTFEIQMRLANLRDSELENYYSADSNNAIVRTRVFDYTIADGTGAYAGLSGEGRLTLEEQRLPRPVERLSLPEALKYTFTRTFTLAFGQGGPLHPSAPAMPAPEFAIPSIPMIPGETSKPESTIPPILMIPGETSKPDSIDSGFAEPEFTGLQASIPPDTLWHPVTAVPGAYLTDVGPRMILFQETTPPTAKEAADRPSSPLETTPSDGATHEKPTENCSDAVDLTTDLTWLDSVK